MGAAASVYYYNAYTESPSDTPSLPVNFAEMQTKAANDC